MRPAPSLALAAALTLLPPLTIASQDPAAPLTPILVSAKETRLWENADTKKPQDENTFMFSAGNDATLTLTLRVMLPPASELLEIRQPKAITATDDTGADLTPIAKGFDDKREHLRKPAFGSQSDFFLSDEEKAQRASKPVEQELELVLIPCERGARTFSVACEGALLVSTGARDVDLPPATAWTPLTDPAFAGLNAKYRVTRENDSSSVELKPDGARERIKDVALVSPDAPEPVTSNGYMAMMGTTTYSFMEPPPANAKVRFIVHENLREVPVKIDIKGAKLP
jgi:hypothetical protein